MMAKYASSFTILHCLTTHKPRPGYNLEPLPSGSGFFLPMYNENCTVDFRHEPTPMPDFVIAIGHNNKNPDPA